MSTSGLLNNLKKHCIAPMPCLCDACVMGIFEEWATDAIEPPIVDQLLDDKVGMEPLFVCRAEPAPDPMDGTRVLR